MADKMRSDGQTAAEAERVGTGNKAIEITKQRPPAAFQKIAWNGSKMRLEWTERHGDADDIACNLESYDAPDEAFTVALQGFLDGLAEILELPESWKDGIRVTGLTFQTDKNERLGITFTALKTLAWFNAPLPLNLPVLWENVSGNANANVLPDEFIAMAERLKARAADYINGRRSQRDLFEDAEADDIQGAADETEDDSEERLAALEAAGRDAALEGKSLDDACPHQKGSIGYTAFKTGWMAGQKAMADQLGPKGKGRTKGGNQHATH